MKVENIDEIIKDNHQNIEKNTENKTIVAIQKENKIEEIKVEDVVNKEITLEDKAVKVTEIEEEKEIQTISENTKTEEKKSEEGNNLENQKQKKDKKEKPEKKGVSIFNSRVFVICVAIVLTLKTMFFYYTGVVKIDSALKFNAKLANIWTGAYTTLAFIGVIMIIPMLLKNRVRFWVTMLINLVISFLLFADDVYYGYSANLVSFSQISNLKYGREISIALPHLLHIFQLVYFIDIIIILILVICKVIKINKKAKYRFWIGLLYTIAMACIIKFAMCGWIEKARGYQYNKLLQINEAGVFGYHYIDIYNCLNTKKNAKYKNTQTMMKAYDKLKGSYDENYNSVFDFSGIAKDKNVIVVQLESVQNFVVNRKINGQEITPNLNKFLNENILFTNMQNQSYSSTADSEYSVMNSVYPLENGMSFAQYASNDYNDMYSLFKTNDYTTAYIHGNEGGFWNRAAVYSRLLIDNLYFDDIFDNDVERISEYVSDEEVYKKIVDEMKKYDGKFMVNIVASSSHTAFELKGIQDRDRKVKLDVADEYRDIYFGDYLEAMNYADYAFGIFIDELVKAGLYDDTVILVYGDHAGLQMYNYEMQDFMNKIEQLNDIKTQINYSNVLCGLKIPEVKGPIVINKPVSKLDIKPTLTEICGIEDEFSLGESMFSTKDFVGINNGKIITDKYFYDGDWYNIDNGEIIDLDSISDDLKEKFKYYEDCVQKELDISLSINIFNLLKK